jgi:ABC-type tungstate transport system permease subunit
VNPLRRRAGLQIVIISLVVVLAWITGFIIGVYHVELSHSSLTQYSVKVSTTTSLYQLGVLDDLFSDFNNVTGLNAKFDVLAKGSGEAIQLMLAQLSTRSKHSRGYIWPENLD